MAMILSTIFLVLILYASYTVIKSSSGFAPWVPTFSRDIERVFNLLGQPNERTFLDLGCGNGRMTIEAAKRGFKATGYELALPLYLICLIRQLVNRHLNLTFRFTNLFTASLEATDIVYLYGLPKKLSQQLTDKLKTELKPGSTIISYCFELPGLNLCETSKPTENDLPIYLYKI